MKLLNLFLYVSIVSCNNETRKDSLNVRNKFPDSLEFMVTSSPVNLKPTEEPLHLISTQKSSRRKQQRNLRPGRSYQRKETTRVPTVEAITIFKCQSSYMKCEYIPEVKDFPFRCKFTTNEVSPS
eukprot:GFUD01042659.1.p1 GENE.GFUD01042659.1~~GFUD01042659.1.p1  ORF type:complete len:125 (+),score=12.97 GFUD01042659.1:87-461(+)